jgi:translation initiation factor 1
MKKGTDSTSIVYSTDPNFYPHLDDSDTAVTLPPGEQMLKIWIEKRSGNRIVTIIRGFIGNDKDLKRLASKLKNTCHSGGTQKSGEVIIQGDHRKKIVDFLKSNGYNAKSAGGRTLS